MKGVRQELRRIYSLQIRNPNGAKLSYNSDRHARIVSYTLAYTQKEIRPMLQKNKSLLLIGIIKD